MLRKYTDGRKRTLPIYGEKDDYGRYFYCWNCGAILDSKRETLVTGSHSKGGIYVQDMPEEATDVTQCNDDLTIIISLQGHKGIIENGPDGLPGSTNKYNQYPKITGGCWFCGCNNYR